MSVARCALVFLAYCDSAHMCVLYVQCSDANNGKEHRLSAGHHAFFKGVQASQEHNARTGALPLVGPHGHTPATLGVVASLDMLSKCHMLQPIAKC